MRKIVWSEYISLDGVVEEPGEWSIPYFSDDLAKYKSDELFASDALLLGRNTYEGLATAWPEMEEVEGDFAVRMNTLPKYVASTTLQRADWNNSTIIRENVPEEVARLKQEPGENILIGGSGALAKSLMQHNLIDEIRMLVHPVALGRGKRLFEGADESIGLQLVDTRAFDSGVVALTYQANTRRDYVKDLYQRWSETFANRGGELPLDEWRATIEEWPMVTAEPGGVDYAEVEARGVPAIWATPKRAAVDRVVLGLHGGGFATGSMYTHRKLFGHLAKAIGVRALVPDYRRAPEHTHPAPVEDAAAAYRWLLDQGIEASHIVFAGDSAGGGLVVTTMLLAREQGLPLPAAGMPLSPWFDFEATGASYDDNDGTDMLLNREFGLRLAGMFLGDTGKPQDPLVSPLHADLAGLPPLYIQASRDEVLVDDSRSFAKRAQQAGLAVRLDLFAGQQHTFQMAAGRSPEADDAIRRLAEWARPKLGL